PHEVTRLPRWPVVEGFRPVTFYPRSAIASVRLSLLEGLTLSLGKAAISRVTLPVPMWHHRRIREALDAGRYPLAPSRS
ncbi:MAG: hypothetical protein ACHQNV_01880, partial [Vicinamibacteria bacterium]